MQQDYMCMWLILDYTHRILLGLCIGIFGIISVILNGWLVITFIRSNFVTFRSHLLLLSLCVASEVKAVFAGFILFGSSALAGKWLYGIVTCHLFAFLRQMLGSFQMVSLSFIAVERYLITRANRKGSDLPLRFYMIGLSVCWLVSLIFSIPPLLGYGRYNCGVSGVGCELDWRLLNTRQITFNVIFSVFGTFLPLFLIFTNLWAANCSIEKPFTSKSFDQRSFTKTITIMIIVILLFWIPQGVLNMWIFVQNLEPPKGIPIALGVIAPISNEVAEIIPILSYLTYDARIRTALLDVCDRPKRHKKMVKFVKQQIRKN